MGDVHHPVICITGGHLTPALAVIEAISRLQPVWRPVFIGRKYARERDTVVSEEYRIFKDLRIPFHALVTGRLTRSVTTDGFVSMAKLPAGFWKAYRLLKTIRPDAVLTFGGYIGLPVGIAAWAMRIPLVVHEQTGNPGLTNRILGFIAGKVLVSDPSVAGIFSKRKTVVTGLPIRKELFTPQTTPPFPLVGTKPLVYITGGATGAMSMNRLIYPVVSRLIRRFELVHQVGRAWEHEARKVRAGLRGDRRPRYHVIPYLDTTAHAWMMNHADIVMGRSGANTVGEAEALGKVCVFLPLPWSAGNEQYHNAKRLADAGSALILDQERTTPEEIAATLEAVAGRMSQYREAARRTAVKTDRQAADRVVTILSEYVG